MKIILNGQLKKFEDDLSLLQLVSAFGKEKNEVIAEINGNIVKNLFWHETTIHDGDVIELVSFVGGGKHLIKSYCHPESRREEGSQLI